MERVGGFKRCNSNSSIGIVDTESTYSNTTRNTNMRGLQINSNSSENVSSHLRRPGHGTRPRVYSPFKPQDMNGQLVDDDMLSDYSSNSYCSSQRYDDSPLRKSDDQQHDQEMKMFFQLRFQ